MQKDQQIHWRSTLCRIYLSRKKSFFIKCLSSTPRAPHSPKNKCRPTKTQISETTNLRFPRSTNTTFDHRTYSPMPFHSLLLTSSRPPVRSLLPPPSVPLLVLFCQPTWLAQAKGSLESSPPWRYESSTDHVHRAIRGHRILLQSESHNTGSRST